MLRLEATDLSQAERIMRHPEICRATGLDPNGPMYPTGPDRVMILLMDDDVAVGYIGFVCQGNVAEVGAGVLPEYRGADVKVSFEAAISSMFIAGMSRITASIPASNKPALGGMIVLGFRRERLVGNIVRFSLTKEKWYQMHPQLRH